MCGSPQRQSSNLTLLQSAITLAPEGIGIVLFDGLRDLPHFNPDEESSTSHPGVRAWREALAGADAVLIATPEYAHSLPGSLKNAIDWVIGSNELYRKLIAITSVVAGGQRGRMGLAALAQALGAAGATIVWDEPITRGPNLEADVARMLRVLSDAERGAAH